MSAAIMWGAWRPGWRKRQTRSPATPMTMPARKATTTTIVAITFERLLGNTVCIPSDRNVDRALGEGIDRCAGVARLLVVRHAEGRDQRQRRERRHQRAEPAG